MPTNGVSGANTTDYSYQRTYMKEAPSRDLTSTDFMKLLAAQLQYQDMTNPMSNSEMMSSLTQMSSMNAMNAMTEAVQSMTSAMNDVLTVNITSYATGMMGKDVTVALLDDDGNATGEKISGTVDAISLFEGTPMVYVGGKAYQLSQVMTIGTVGSKNIEDEKTEGEDGKQDGEGQDSSETGNVENV